MGLNPRFPLIMTLGLLVYSGFMGVFRFMGVFKVPKTYIVVRSLNLSGGQVWQLVFLYDSMPNALNGVISITGLYDQDLIIFCWLS